MKEENYDDIKKHLLNLYKKLISAEDQYIHKAAIPVKEQPYIFHKHEKKSATPDEVFLGLNSALDSIIVDTDARELIQEWSNEVRSYSNKVIDSCDSFFFFIEFDGGAVDPKFKKDGVYKHYHPPRQADRNYLHTISYIMPLKNIAAQIPNFCSIDLRKHDLSGHSYEYFRNKPIDTIIKDYERLTEETKNLSWSKYPFPASGMMEIVFDSYRYFHNVEDIKDDIFLIYSFNEVALKPTFLWQDLESTLECNYYPRIKR